MKLFNQFFTFTVIGLMIMGCGCIDQGLVSEDIKIPISISQPDTPTIQELDYIAQGITNGVVTGDTGLTGYEFLAKFQYAGMNESGYKMYILRNGGNST